MVPEKFNLRNGVHKMELRLYASTRSLKVKGEAKQFTLFSFCF